MKKILFIILIPLSFLGQNIVCFDIEDNPNPSIDALALFSKYINVLDCIHIYAEQSISDEKILHAAAIAAELLDNNEDGVVDDENVKTALMNTYTVMPLFSYKGSNAEEILFDNFDDLIDNNNFCAGAVLYNNEIDSSSPGFWGNDASVEELLHTINTCSHVWLM